MALGLGFALEVEGFEIAGAAAEVSASCRAREAAVGAVRREEISRGLVTFGLDVVVEDAGGLPTAAVALSAAAARATEAAVGAVRDERPAFLVGCEVVVGDLMLETRLLPVELLRSPLVFPVREVVVLGDFLVVVVDFLRKSSVVGERAAPPLTASSLVGSAGFMTAGSSSAPVVGLSGF
jgi:hypothetical protein